MAAKDWWFQVFDQTYKTTKDLTTIKGSEFDRMMPDISSILFNEIFGSKEGWSLKEDTLYTLEKLKEWRDIGSGPKVGIISNFDDRLHDILKGEPHSTLILSQFNSLILYLPSVPNI